MKGFVTRASFALVLAASHAGATGFPDQGFSSGPPRVRTDYTLSNEGTAANPLTRGACLYPPSGSPPYVGPCATGPNVYSQSNYWRQNWPASCDVAGANCLYWVLGLNNEDASSTLNPGPPDASLPRAAPGSGIMGFSTLYGNDNFPGDTLWRAHLVLNVSSGFDNPAPGATPFLSLGAFAGHGTNPTIGVLNPSSGSALSVISFGERLWGFTPPVRRYPTQDSSIASYLWIVTKWGTKPRMIALMLAHDHFKNSSATTVGHNHWNWNIQESVYYPGADIVYIDVEDVVSHCGYSIPRLTTVGQEINYRIDATRLFRCMSSHFDEPFPTTANIPITGVIWANEATGKDGGIWVDVHQMKMITATGALAAGDDEFRAVGTMRLGPGTGAIENALEQRCLESPGCFERESATLDDRVGR